MGGYCQNKDNLRMRNAQIMKENFYEIKMDVVYSDVFCSVQSM